MTDIKGRRVSADANGLRHELLLYNEDAGRDLYLVPGITSPAETADFVATELAEAGFRVAVPDVRGRGGSDVAPSGGYTLADYAADAAGLVEELGLRQPVLFGHSMGARIVAAQAPLLQQSPELVVMVDPPVSGPGRAPYPTTREQFLTQLHEAQAGTDVAAVRRWYPGWPERELRIRAEVLATCDETAVVETHAGFESEDFHRYFAELDAPAIVVRGAESPVLPADAAAELRAMRPDIEVIDVPNSGHMIPWDNFAGFMDSVLPHLAPD